LHYIAATDAWRRNTKAEITSRMVVKPAIEPKGDPWTVADLSVNADRGHILVVGLTARQ
jgi:hypothetical protein